MELLNIKNYVKERKESLKEHSQGAIMVQLPLPPQLDIEIIKLIIPP